MRIYDLISSLFFLGCGIFITINSWRLPVGTFHQPDSGLLPLIVGVLISSLSAVLLIRSLVKKGPSGKKKPFWGQDSQGYKTVITVAVLLAYAVIFEWLGFLLTTFLLTTTLFKPIGGLGWKSSLGGAVLISVISYLFFNTFLKVELPVGPWGF